MFVPVILNTCLALYQSGDYLGQDPSWPNSFPFPGVTQLPSFSGNVLQCNRSPSRVTLPLCVSHCIFIPPSSDFKHPSLSWCNAAFPSLVEEGAADPTLLQSSCACASPRLAPDASPGPQQPWSLSWSQCKLLTIYFLMSSTILASKLHINWDSVGCSLCSSDY